MRPASLTAAAVCLIALGSHACGFEQPIELKVLYAGDAKSERTADFRAFLEQHFAKVGISDYLSLKAADTKGYDVVILDWPDLPPRNEKGFQRPALESDYDRPTVLIGGGTLGISRHLELKVDDLCICLGDAAHGIRTGHEIFQKPYLVEIRLEDRPTPSYYRYSPEGESLGRMMKVWKVQERGWSPEKPDDMSILPGMVSDACGFEDSPDAEIISSGINLKSPAAVAIGRHGNFLLWGFYAAPSGLTPEARKCLANAICYIRKFDGQKPLVHKRRGHVARQRQLLAAFWYEEVSDPQWFAESQPESLRKDPAKLAELHRQRIEDFHRSSFPEDVRCQLGGEPNRYIAYYRANLEYLHPPEGRSFPLEVDEDVKTLGLSNRKLPLLERCIAMLERNDRPELALRILRRYTTEDFSETARWRSWLETNRRRLFFSDIGGFKFLVAPKLSSQGAAIGNDGEPPDAQRPLAARAELLPAKVRVGGGLEIVIELEMAPTWHIYAVGASKGPGAATTLKLTLPEAVVADGEWSCPEAVKGADGQMIYEGTVRFRHRLRVLATAVAGPIDISCELGYQACDPFRCRLPAKAELRARGEITADGR